MGDIIPEPKIYPYTTDLNRDNRITFYLILSAKAVSEITQHTGFLPLTVILLISVFSLMLR